MSTPTRDQIEQAVVERLRERHALRGYKPGSKRALDFECEYLVGAMTAIGVIFPNEDPSKLSEMIPPAWIFAPMTGRSVLEKKGQP